MYIKKAVTRHTMKWEVAALEKAGFSTENVQFLKLGAGHCTIGKAMFCLCAQNEILGFDLG